MNNGSQRGWVSDQQQEAMASLTGSIWDTQCSKEQVGILISKSQALQILYLKHHVYKTSWIRNLTKSMKI